MIQQQDASFLLSAKSGQDVVLECPTTANPKPTIKWLKHPYFEMQDDRVHIKFKDNNSTLVKKIIHFYFYIKKKNKIKIVKVWVLKVFLQFLLQL